MTNSYTFALRIRMCRPKTYPLNFYLWRTDNQIKFQHKTRTIFQQNKPPQRTHILHIYGNGVTYIWFDTHSKWRMWILYLRTMYAVCHVIERKKSKMKWANSNAFQATPANTSFAVHIISIRISFEALFVSMFIVIVRLTTHLVNISNSHILCDNKNEWRIIHIKLPLRYIGRLQ